MHARAREHTYYSVSVVVFVKGPAGVSTRRVRVRTSDFGSPFSQPARAATARARCEAEPAPPSESKSDAACQSETGQYYLELRRGGNHINRSDWNSAPSPSPSPTRTAAAAAKVTYSCSNSLDISPRFRWVVCPLGRTRGHGRGYITRLNTH